MVNRFELTGWLYSWFIEQYWFDWQYGEYITNAPDAVCDAFDDLLLGHFDRRW